MPELRPNMALQQWTQRHRGREAPAFLESVRDLLELTDSQRTSASDLAFVILRDPALTARVLQVAHSVALNPARYPVSSISRAVVMLGFNAVRRIALTLILIDACLRGPARERLARELALSIHASVQARAIALTIGDENPEEICIAALLHNLGAIVFWSSGDESALTLDHALAGTALPPETEQRVLGFELRHLTGELNREWQVSRLLERLLCEHEASRDRRLRCVEAGWRIALASEHGAPIDNQRETVAALVCEFNIDRRVIEAQLRDAATQAAETMTLYGAGAMRRYLPVAWH
jgi:HD-like signal output (HDOD) protein